MYNFIGVDPGQKTTTVAVLCEDGGLAFHSFEQPNQYSVMSVATFTNSRVQQLVEKIKFSGEIGAAAIESPALAARGQAFSFGAVYTTLLLNFCYVAELTLWVAPVKLKYAATGKGKADKKEIIRAVKLFTGRDVGSDHNKADAAVLAFIAKEAYCRFKGVEKETEFGSKQWMDTILSNQKKVKGKTQGIMTRPGELYWSSKDTW